MYISASPNVHHRSKRSTELVTFIDGFDGATTKEVGEGTRQGLKCHFTINGETPTADVRCMKLEFKWAHSSRNMFTGHTSLKDWWHVLSENDGTIDEVGSALSSDDAERLSSSPVDLDTLNNEGHTLTIDPVLMQENRKELRCNVICHTQSETLDDSNTVKLQVTEAGKYKTQNLHCLATVSSVTVTKCYSVTVTKCYSFTTSKYRIVYS